MTTRKARTGGAWLAVAVLLVLCAGPLRAQWYPTDLRAGEAVRIRPAGAEARQIDAVVVRAGPGWIEYRGRDVPAAGVQTRVLQQGDLLGILREVPESQRLQRGALWGAFLGGSLGGVLAPLAATRSDLDTGGLRGAGMGVLIGGIVGAGTGALLGALIPRQRWVYFQVVM